MIGRVLFATVVGLAFGSVAAVFGHYLAALLNPTHPPELSRSFFVVTPAVSAGLAAAITWWFVVIRPGKPGWVRGAIAGALGVLSSYVLFAVLASALLYGIQFFPWLLILPPLVTGWLTLPVGAALGAVLGPLQHRLWGPATVTPAPAD